MLGLYGTRGRLEDSYSRHANREPRPEVFSHNVDANACLAYLIAILCITSCVASFETGQVVIFAARFLTMTHGAGVTILA